MERTLVLLKPDAIQRALAGSIIKRIEDKGLKIVGMKLMKVSTNLAEKHYSEHVDRPFFEGLVKFITSSPIIAMAIEGPGAIAVIRNIMGITDPQSAPPGTIRGDYGLEIGLNLVHGSDSAESAARELALFFTDQEIVSYDKASEPWIIES